MTKKIKITLVRSPLACLPRHRRTVRALGLKKIGQAVIHDNNDAIRGMANSVTHLVIIEEAK